LTLFFYFGLKILDKSFQAQIEPLFINTKLGQGDLFFFNRRLAHRGGHNKSAMRRNSVIFQVSSRLSFSIETASIMLKREKTEPERDTTEKRGSQSLHETKTDGLHVDIHGVAMSYPPRCCLLKQNVFLFGVGQHATDFDTIMPALERTRAVQQLTSEAKHDLAWRLQAPYPLDTRKTT